jgi:hypothetical protein
MYGCLTLHEYINYSVHVAIPCKHRLWVGATPGITEEIIDAHTSKQCQPQHQDNTDGAPLITQPLWDHPLIGAVKLEQVHANTYHLKG